MNRLCMSVRKERGSITNGDISIHIKKSVDTDKMKFRRYKIKAKYLLDNYKLVHSA
jgi:hypothetical protein